MWNIYEFMVINEFLKIRFYYDKIENWREPNPQIMFMTIKNIPKKNTFLVIGEKLYYGKMARFFRDGNGYGKVGSFITVMTGSMVSKYSKCQKCIPWSYDKTIFVPEKSIFHT